MVAHPEHFSTYSYCQAKPCSVEAKRVKKGLLHSLLTGKSYRRAGAGYGHGGLEMAEPAFAFCFRPQNHNFWLPKAGAALQEHTDEQLWQPANAATNNPGQAKAKKTTLSTR